MTDSVRSGVQHPITGIGSLPHLSVDAALDYAFRYDIPYLPQLPILNPRERMIHQALAGFPGVQPPAGAEDTETGAILDVATWSNAQAGLRQSLDQAFQSSHRKNAFEEFLPRQEDYRALRPFIWELSERHVTQAKLQLAGPVTTLRNLKTRDGSPISPELERDLLQFLLARSIALVRLAAEAVTDAPDTRVLFSLDEPWLFALKPEKSPRDALALRELGLQLDAIRKHTDQARVRAGMHCCSDPDWTRVLDAVKPDFLSIDASVSLHSLTGTHKAALDAHQAQGGLVFWGVIPANTSLDTISISPGLAERSVFTPACGLAYHSPLECEEVWERLTQAAHRPTTG